MTEIGNSSTGTRLEVPGTAGLTVTLAWAAVTDVGRRRQANEDSYLAEPPIFAVADGMGGHLSGDIASAAVVDRLNQTVSGAFATTVDIENALALASVDIGIVAGDSAIGVGTTVTGAVLTVAGSRPYFTVFNIGDSRVYQFERNDLRQVTTDHSLVQELVDAGIISAAQAYDHPDGNIITRAVGFEARPVPDYSLVPLRAGLRLLICSDGLTGELQDERLRLHFSAGLSPDATAGALVDAALAAGGRDNVTVVVVDVVSVDEALADDTSSGVTDSEDTAPGS